MFRVASIATIVFALVAVLLSGHSSDAASVEIDSDGVDQSRTLHEIVKSQRRYVLYNSRQLSGECLDVCVPTVRTDPPVPPVRPTDPPVDASTLEPTREPSSSPTGAPTSGPTSSPTDAPTSGPTSSPTDAPTSGPTSSPTEKPTSDPTSSPTEKPTSDPTSSPTGTICQSQKELNVCIAIDNSGSVCSRESAQKCDEGCSKNNPFDHDSGCNAGTDKYEETHGEGIGSKSCCGNMQTVKDFAIDYIDSLTVDEGTVSVVNFASTAKVISSRGTKEEAIEKINKKLYTGGFTNTEDAITRCTDQVKGLVNPVVILVTDGTPTACTEPGGGWAKQWDSDCGEHECDACTYGAPKAAATHQADYADAQGVKLVPVVITSVSTKRDYLMSLARCPGDDDPECGFGELWVEHIEDMPTVLEDLVKDTACGDEE